MDVLLLSRLQFAINIGFHYLYPPISIGLGLMLVIMEGLYLKTRDSTYRDITQFWIKIFALVFAIGVATGLVQGFAFGTNWARFSRFVGDVFGSALAAEGMFAFFLESGFLGVLLFGWDRVGPRLHYLATICVCVGAHFSAVWIVIAGSWMQTPAGFRIEETPYGPRAVITQFWEMVFNPSALDRLVHVLLGCWLTGAFFVMSVAAFYLLKNRHIRYARVMMQIGLVVAGISLVLQLISGDSSAKYVAKYQPAKLAAFEGLYHTVPASPMTIIGWVDPVQQQVHGWKVPGLLSFFTYGNWHDPVMGLEHIPRDEWPNVPLVFQTYHLMVLTWILMMILVLVGCGYWIKGTFIKKRGVLWSFVFAVLLPHIGQQAGWISAEAGRQPWVVWKLLRTSEGVSTTLHSHQLISSITMFILIYLLLFVLFLFLLDRKIRQGPEEHDQRDLLYRVQK
jgi:cytochrome bd ubiquinol oxidase subunit I